ncbi:hypothetical protein L6452_19402 [Arctium lappa]|uniref:Uncharacterized protein n=1 Tax=Arctium lappa TaxID=4217 RepID=A0ACB9B8V1_ARCLA|nr:hypothetical protein L6452_19402 [Arctium lappa]
MFRSNSSPLRRSPRVHTRASSRASPKTWAFILFRAVLVREVDTLRFHGMSLEEIVKSLALSTLEFQQETKASLQNLENQISRNESAIRRLEAQLEGGDVNMLEPLVAPPPFLTPVVDLIKEEEFVDTGRTFTILETPKVDDEKGNPDEDILTPVPNPLMFGRTFFCRTFTCSAYPLPPFSKSLSCRSSLCRQHPFMSKPLDLTYFTIPNVLLTIGNGSFLLLEDILTSFEMMETFSKRSEKDISVMASSSKVDPSSFSFQTDNGSMVKPPWFNANNFSLWKSRMMLFLEGADSRYLTVLREGPIVPKVWARFETQKPRSDLRDKDVVFGDSDDSSDEERTSATGRYLLKNPRKYNDDDKRLFALDSRVRAIIALSLPDEVYHSLVNLSTAKEMWSTLCILYEGTDEVKKSKKIALVRKYKLFSHEKGEYLSDYYNRFNNLLNDLKLLGRVYDNEEVLCKFMDGLPDFWENICTCIKTTKDLDHMSLTVLYGSLFNYEQTMIQMKIVIKEIRSSSMALISDSFKKSVCIPRITYPSDSDHNSQEEPNDPSEAYLSEAGDEGV